MRYAGMFIVWVMVFIGLLPVFVMFLGTPITLALPGTLVFVIAMFLSYMGAGLSSAWIAFKAFQRTPKPIAAARAEPVEVAPEAPVPKLPVRPESDNPYESPRSYSRSAQLTDDVSEPDSSSLPRPGGLLFFGAAMISVIAMVSGVMLAIDLSVTVGRSDLGRVIQIFVCFLLVVGGFFGLRFMGRYYRRSSDLQ